MVDTFWTGTFCKSGGIDACVVKRLRYVVERYSVQ